MFKVSLPHSQNSSSYPGYKLICFAYISYFFAKNKHTSFYPRHVAFCLQMILLHQTSMTNKDCCLLAWFGSKVIRPQISKVSKIDCLRFGMCCYLHLPSKASFFLLQPLTVLMKQTRQVVCTFKQSILLRCLWL